ncbi:conserved hypothetical protein [Histoplasma capsulatum var. duboisii H88]|uniref:Uncharacterized protein n=2 Tax=Ajellomyces capsulatus (strain H88) TaxID=544711 RepID=F0UK39_AJEC8|nr:conserved hypothetical protein [Histoplasma capsulatum var. duboisii H88]
MALATITKSQNNNYSKPAPSFACVEAASQARMDLNRINGTAARVSHVNLMTDTLITNLSPDALRVILRSMLAADENGQLTHKLQHHVQKYLRRDLQRTQRTSTPALFSVVDKSSSSFSTPTPELAKLRNRICTLLGSGLPFESLQLLAEVVRQSCGLELDDTVLEGESLVLALAAVDGNLVQALTAVQKLAILHDWANGGMPTAQRQVLLRLRTDLENCREQSEGVGGEFGFGRGSVMLESILSQMWE